MSMDRQRYLSALRADSEALVACGRLGLAAAVPACPGWDVARLLDHLTKIYTRTALVVGERLTAPPESVPPGPAAGAGGDPVAGFQLSFDACLAALEGADPTAPVWNFSGHDLTAGWWPRRMAHETSVHRVDGQQAHGIAASVPGDLAADGIDEYLQVVVPRQAGRGVPEPLVGRHVELIAPDVARAWLLALGGDRVTVSPPGAAPPDVVASGPASTLLLALYGRLPWADAEVAGDQTLLQAWQEGLPITAR